MKPACRLFCASLLLFVAAACGDDPPPRQDGAVSQCGPSSCSGCCLNGACQTGTTPQACGAGGYGCNVCTSTEVCKAGLCQPKAQTCSSSSCPTGCCQGTSCMGGASLSACGTGGGACKMCNVNEKCITGKCVPTSGDCSPSNCTGCCQNKQCKSGTATAVCGAGGSDCRACKTGEQCKGGSCVPTGLCSPSTCASGCCNNGQCKGGTDASACGTGGNACKTCQSNETCTGGACVPTTGTCGPSSCATGCCQNNQCKGGTLLTACGTGGTTCQSCKSGETCTNKTCKGSGPAQYKVYLKSAALTSSAWVACVEANCDMYVKLVVGSTTATSKIKADNNAPTWNELLLVTTDTALKASFKATVFDDDIGPDGLIGNCSATITSAVLQKGSLEIQCTYLTTKAVKVTFGFVKN